MHSAPFLEELVANFLIIISASVVVIFVSHQLRLSSVVGFLLTGMLIGPSGLGLIRQDQVELLAEIGVVILLFTIGLEFSLAQLRRNWRPFLMGGGLQVTLTIGVTAAIAMGFRLPLTDSLFLGFLAALSSTAIVLKSYADRRELRAAQGTLATGILLFQDVCLAPMIILTPILAGTVAVSSVGVLSRLGQGILLIAGTFALARIVMPRILHSIVRTRVREIFLLGALGVCLGMAMLTARLGFSLALGAFLAGLIISESEYSHEVIAEVLPFRDLFNSIFFISLGMLLSFDAVRAHWPVVLALGVGIIVVKALIVAAVVGFMMYPVRIALITGLSLAQVGEFSFVLGGVGLQLGLLEGTVYQAFLGASIFTMLLTPLWIHLAPRVAERAPQWNMPGLLQRLRVDVRVPESSSRGRFQKHVIVVGYGLNGRNVTRVLHETAIPFVVLELNGDLVRRARQEGLPVIYGDATRPELLEVCGIRDASMLVLAISDMAGARHTVRAARRANSEIYILARTRLVEQIDELYREGANDVIPEEFETSIEIFSRVLAHYHVPRNIVEAQVRIIRGEGYSMLRGGSSSTTVALDRIAEVLEATLTDTFLVTRGSPGEGRTLRELALRGKTGATVIAVVRSGEPTTNPSPDLRLGTNDTLVLVGNHAALEKAFVVLGAKASVEGTGAAPTSVQSAQDAGTGKDSVSSDPSSVLSSKGERDAPSS